MKRRAFTLIELLVVIAIVIILGAILFPVFQGTHCGPSPRSFCQSNLKQIGLGFLQYTQDYDEHFPRTVGGGSAYGWADALQPYLKSTQIYQCPSEPNPAHTSNPTPVTPRTPDYTDYWFNSNLSGQSWTYDPYRGTTLIMTGEGNTGTEWTDARYAKTQFPTAWLQDESSPAYRHFDGMNLGFADGHVKWYSARNLTPNETHAGLRMTVPTYPPERPRNRDEGQK